MFPWLDKWMEALPAGVRAQVLPVLMQAGMRLWPYWIKLKTKGAELGGLAAAAPEVLGPMLRDLDKTLRENPEAVMKIVEPVWGAIQQVISHPVVRAQIHQLLIKIFDLAGEQIERGLRWMDSPDSTRRLGEGLTMLENLIGGWLERHGESIFAPPPDKKTPPTNTEKTD